MRSRFSGVFLLSVCMMGGLLLSVLLFNAPGEAKSDVNVINAHGDVLSSRSATERVDTLEAEQPEVDVTVFPATPESTSTENVHQDQPALKATPAKKAYTPKPLTREQALRKQQEEQAQANNEALANLSNIHKDAIRHLDRATQLGVKGQLKAAFLEYESAIRINPNLADAYVGKAAVYGYQGQWDKAISSLQMALNMDSNFISPANRINAQFNLSSCYCFQGNAQAAWENYSQNIEGKHPRSEALLAFMEKTCPQESGARANDDK